MSLEFLQIESKPYIRFKGRLCKFLFCRILKRLSTRKCFIDKKLVCRTIRKNVAQRDKDGTKIQLYCMPSICPLMDRCQEFTLLKIQIFDESLWLELPGNQDVLEGAMYKLLPVVRNNKVYPKLVIW